MKERLYSGLLSWMNFDESDSVLLIGEAVHSMDTFADIGCSILCNTVDEIYDNELQEKYSHIFDYVVGVEVLEKERNPERLLNVLRTFLKSSGKLLLGTDNRLGIRYLCGEHDPYSGRYYESFENYEYIDNEEIPAGKCYTNAELRDIVKNSGLQAKFYSVLPSLEHPQLIIAENYTPKEKISSRYTPVYRNPDTILFCEEQVCEDFAQNGMIHATANAFFIECTLDGNFTDANQITVSLNRGEENAYFTILRSDTVEKRIAYSAGEKNLRELSENLQNLQDRGIDVVLGKKDGNSYIMPYVDAVMGDIYLRNLLKTDRDEFIKKMDEFRGLILQSSESVDENEYGVILQKGYIDMVPLNSFFMNDHFVFFDQEFCIANYPLNAILYRAIVILYENVPESQVMVTKEMLWDRYDMSSQLDYYNKITTEFVNTLRRQDKMTTFYDSHMRNEWIANYNRQYLNKVVKNMDFYEDYRRDRCFDDLHDKKVFLFGAGKWCDKFLAFYKNEYNVCRILDNDESKWGTKMDGVPIDSPESIVGEQDAYKVIICTKDYKPIFRQLKRMQVLHIGIYDANYCYAGRQRLSIFPPEGSNKKYHIGYISGTFDVFHIGHINILRRAKEQCEYLIAAVTSDEYVRTHKNKEPIIPFEERVEMLKACKYVDEVVGVPVKYAGTVEAFQKYHFDCQFCGSDYVDDPWWLEQKKFLQEHGSDLVFFPYTEQTNSTKIRALIENNL